MAPELFPKSMAKEDAENIKYKKTVDVYSLALILHQLFGGGTDFFPTCHNNITLSFAKSRGEPPMLKLGELPPRLRRVISNGVATDPKKRPTLDEFFGAVMRAKPDDPQSMGAALFESHSNASLATEQPELPPEKIKVED